MILYKCDNKKNIECKGRYSSNCYLNCNATKNKKYAKCDENGKPIVFFNDEKIGSKKIDINGTTRM